MGRRRCCCDSGCWQFFDDFNDLARQGSTNLGSSWNEVVGDWGIVGFELIEDFSTGVSGTANSLLICTEQQPAYSAGEQYLSVDVLNPQTGDFYYLYPCCTSTSVIGTITVEFECISGPSQWMVRIGALEKAFTVTTDILGAVRLVACVDDTISMAKAWVNYGANEPLWDDNISPGAGRYSGFGHNNIGHLNEFDNYFVGELRLENGAECNDCYCRCLEEAPGKALKGTVYDATGRSLCMDGLDFDLDYYWNSGTYHWEGTLTIPPVYPSSGVEQDLFFILRCESYGDTDEAWPGRNFNLENVYRACCKTGCGPIQPLTTSTCDPINLVFGPFEMRNDDFLCFACYSPFSGPTPGYYYIVVTEA